MKEGHVETLYMTTEMRKVVQVALIFAARNPWVIARLKEVNYAYKAQYGVLFPSGPVYHHCL